MLIRISVTWFCNILIFITFTIVKKYKHVKIRRNMLLYYGRLLYTHQRDNQENRFMYFLSKSQEK